jgi:hypothetical protein
MTTYRRNSFQPIFVLSASLFGLYLSGELLPAQEKNTSGQQETIKDPLRLEPGGDVTFVTFSRDGKTLAYGLAPFGVDGPGSKVEAATVLINVADGKEKLRITADKLTWLYFA